MLRRLASFVLAVGLLGWSSPSLLGFDDKPPATQTETVTPACPWAKVVTDLLDKLVAAGLAYALSYANHGKPATPNTPPTS